MKMSTDTFSKLKSIKFGADYALPTDDNFGRTAIDPKKALEYRSIVNERSSSCVTLKRNFAIEFYLTKDIGSNFKIR